MTVDCESTETATITRLEREIKKLRAMIDIMSLDIDKPLRVVLRERREELGITRQELAKSMSVVPSYLSMIETGTAPIPRMRLAEFARLLDLDPRKVAALAVMSEMSRLR